MGRCFSVPVECAERRKRNSSGGSASLEGSDQLEFGRRLLLLLPRSYTAFVALPYEIKKIITVCKAYSSAVGAGAFVSEIFGEEADELRRRGGDGGEYGATTGRPRRMGWFDCVASKYGCRMQGTTDVAFTVLDVLGYLDEIPVCTGYEIDGKVTTEFPTTGLLEKAKPVLEVLPGWKCDIRGIRKYEDLPENCRKYIEFVEKQIGFPITMVSNGPGRNDIIYRK